MSAKCKIHRRWSDIAVSEIRSPQPPDFLHNFINFQEKMSSFSQQECFFQLFQFLFPQNFFQIETYSISIKYTGLFSIFARKSGNTDNYKIFKLNFQSNVCFGKNFEGAAGWILSTHVLYDLCWKKFDKAFKCCLSRHKFLKNPKRKKLKIVLLFWIIKLSIFEIHTQAFSSLTTQMTAIHLENVS